MCNDFIRKIKDYIYRKRCSICKGYLFLIRVDDPDKDIIEGTIYCADCDQKSKKYFYK